MAKAAHLSGIHVSPSPGGGTDIKRIKKYSVTVDLTSCTAATTNVQTASVTGLKSGDLILVQRPSGLNAGLSVDAACYADDTLSLIINNATAGALDPASAVFEILAFSF